MNSYNFTGNIGKDCEQRFTAGGDSIVSFTVAVTSGYGEKAITTWVNCSIWGKRGESVIPYLTKGQQVGISGELTNRPYTDKAGVAKHSLDVRVSDLTLLGSKGEKQDARQPASNEAKPNEQSSGFDDSSDIPW